MLKLKRYHSIENPVKPQDGIDDQETESGDASENASRAEDRDDIEQVRQEVAIGRAGPAN